jgi:hypothetical protein
MYLIRFVGERPLRCPKLGDFPFETNGIFHLAGAPLRASWEGRRKNKCEARKMCLGHGAKVDKLEHGESYIELEVTGFNRVSVPR